MVDDGSTDNSKTVINKYNDSIKKIFQRNLGMMEAANSGFSLATGEIIIFLDADDYLYENAVEEIVKIWDPQISKVHFRLKVVNNENQDIGYFPPLKFRLAEGDVWKKIIEEGTYITAPMSGNAFSRSVLKNIFPIIDADIKESNSYFDRIPTDAYLKLRIPFYGPVRAIQYPLGAYRIHGQNNGANKSPYLVRKKRQRKLILAKLNANFISQMISGKNIHWCEDILFLDSKFLKLRMLSLRFDEADHLLA